MLNGGSTTIKRQRRNPKKYNEPSSNFAGLAATLAALSLSQSRSRHCCKLSPYIHTHIFTYTCKNLHTVSQRFNRTLTFIIISFNNIVIYVISIL